MIVHYRTDDCHCHWYRFVLHLLLMYWKNSLYWYSGWLTCQFSDPCIILNPQASALNRARSHLEGVLREALGCQKSLKLCAHQSLACFIVPSEGRERWGKACCNLWFVCVYIYVCMYVRMYGATCSLIKHTHTHTHIHTHTQMHTCTYAVPGYWSCRPARCGQPATHL